jgi:hypothetical protein
MVISEKEILPKIGHSQSSFFKSRSMRGYQAYEKKTKDNKENMDP